MQTNLTLEQLRDLFYMEDRLGITIHYNPTTGSFQVPTKHGMASYMSSLEEVYSYIKGYYDAASNTITLDPGAPK